MKIVQNPEVIFDSRAWKAEQLTLAVMRITTGVFLIYGVTDNIFDPKRMQEFVGFMNAVGFSGSRFWAPFSVYTQLLAGLMLVLGLGTRSAGALIAITFIVGLYMVHWSQSLREWWPALALVIIGLHFITRGAGSWSLDTLISGRFGNERQ